MKSASALARRWRRAFVACVLAFGPIAAAQAARPTPSPRQASPVASFVQSLKGLMPAVGGNGTIIGWSDLERDSTLRWTPLQMHDEVLADGNYFSRLGIDAKGTGTMQAMATGARAGVFSIYFENRGQRFGEAEMLVALRRGGFAPQILRCPAAGAQRAQAGWYRLTLAGKRRAIFEIDPGCRGTGQCEAYALHVGNELPVLSPREARLYSEDCTGDRAAVIPAGAPSDEEKLARVIGALLPPAAPLRSKLEWAALARTPLIAWKHLPPLRMDTSLWLDDHPFLLEGEIALPTRRMAVYATGDAAGAINVYLQDARLFAPTDVLEALRRQGLQIRLAMCGKPYIEMREDWFRIAGPAFAPAVLYHRSSCESGLCQEAFGVLLDDRVPSKPGQRLPGAQACAER